MTPKHMTQVANSFFEAFLACWKRRLADFQDP
jgi:hypothetical protein